MVTRNWIHGVVGSQWLICCVWVNCPFNKRRHHQLQGLCVALKLSQTELETVLEGSQSSPAYPRPLLSPSPSSLSLLSQSLDRNIVVLSHARLSSLTLKNVQFTYAGQYLCSAANAIGQDSQPVHLEVRCESAPPTFCFPNHSAVRSTCRLSAASTKCMTRMKKAGPALFLRGGRPIRRAAWSAPLVKLEAVPNHPTGNKHDVAMLLDSELTAEDH